MIEKSQTLTVTFHDETSVEAVVKGTDATKDLAVVAVPLKQISSDTKDSIKVAVLGDSENLLVGEEVIAIGNALGYGQSVTNGIVSAKDREIEMEGFDSKLIQTNAAIKSGKQRRTVNQYGRRADRYQFHEDNGYLRRGLWLCIADQ